MDENNMENTGGTNLPSVSDVTVEPYEEKPLSGFLENKTEENGETENLAEDGAVPGEGSSTGPAEDGDSMSGEETPEETPETPDGEGSETASEGVKAEEGSTDGPDDPDEPEIKPPSKAVLILIACVIVIGALAALVISYMIKDRNKPAEKVEEFLEYAKELDFEGMQSCLKSEDISALDGTDLTDDTYESFFREMSGELSYDITRVRIDHQVGTAQVTAHITYVDASQIYAQTVSEFLSHVVNATLDDASIPDTDSEEVQATLLRLLTEKAAETETTYSEAEIMYPMILEDGIWKIVSLDTQTVRALAGNSAGIENEIRGAVAGIDPDSEEKELSQEPENEPAGFEVSAETYTIRYTGHELGTDFAGNPCLKIFYDYTNLSEFPSSPLRDVRILVYQHGKKCPAAIPAENRNDIDSFYEQAEEGETISVCQIFSLTDLSSLMIQADGDGMVSDTLTLLLEEEEK